MRCPTTLQALLFGALIMVGCGRSNPPAYPVWQETEPAYTPSERSKNAFDGYVRASLAAVQADPKNAERVSFTPGQRKAALDRLRPALAVLESATRSECEFEYRAQPPVVPPAHHQGWRLLGRALAWRIEDAVQTGNFDSAVRTLRTAAKFSFDLTGGSAMDAALGYTIMDEARDALAPALTRLGAGQLNQAATAVAVPMSERPSPEEVAANERKAMLAGVQWVQDSVRDGRYKELERFLGADGDGLARRLKGLADDPNERANYFAGLASAARRESELLALNLAKPLAERSKPARKNADPWDRLGRHFWYGGTALLGSHDRTLARCRLFVATSLILSQVKAARKAPPELETFGPVISDCPYTGKTFVYRADGADFKLYSVGEDLRDDGGRTDADGLRPDLVLAPGSGS